MATDTAPNDVRALEAGLDALDSLVAPVPASATRAAWRAFWPTAAAVLVFGGVWQAVRGLPWVLRERRPLPERVERRFAVLERAQRTSTARRYVS